MTGEELAGKIKDEIGEDERLHAILDRIREGKATFTDSELYAAITARITAQQMQRNVLSLEKREAAFVGITRERYTDTFTVFSAVQRILDAESGIHIRPKEPGFDTGRARKIGHSLEDRTVPDSTIERRARSATENFCMSHHDDCMRVNAEFRARAGLQSYAIRDGSAKCCDWCADVSGKYPANETPAGFWGRHDNCKCSILYESKRSGRQLLRGAEDNTRRWEVVPENAGAEPLVRLTHEQAAAIQERNRFTVLTHEQALALQEKHGLTNPAESGRIDYARIIDSMFYADDYEYQTYTKEEIIEHLKTSPVGAMAIEYLESNPQVKVKLSEDAEETNRGQHENNLLTIWLRNCPNVRVAAQTVVHEVAHHKYDIGGSQLAETICFAFEKMHKEGRDYVTQEEWEILVEQVKNAYSDYPIGGGVGDIKRFDFIIKKR